MDIPATFNMARHVLEAGQKTPDKPALEVVGAAPFVLTFGQLNRAIRGVATGLLEQGMQPGDRVLLRLSNTPLFPICYLASIAVDLVPVPTSPQLTTPEVDKIYAVIEPALTIQGGDVAAPSLSPQILRSADVEAMQDLPSANFIMGDPDRPAYIVFTSGTGGTPRAVVHAHRAVLARQWMFDGWYGLTPDDRLLHAGAFNWTYTMGTGLVDPWTKGATSLIPAPQIGALDLPHLIAKHKASIFAAAPGVYRRMLKSLFPVVSSLRHGLSAGEKLPEITRTQWETATQTPIYEAFGMSECSTFVSGSPARPAPKGTLGFAQPGRQVRIGPSGMIEIHRSDPGLMLGYLHDPTATEERFNGDWFQTGDAGEMTPEGAIAYAGRADDMINAGGLRISPIEIEDALHTKFPACDWACTEVRIKADVSIIAAFYAGTDVIEEDQAKAGLAPLLAAYKIPRLFVPVDTLPRGANNKLLRRKLRSDWEARHGQT